jgi:hypothetical protein
LGGGSGPGRGTVLGPPPANLEEKNGNADAGLWGRGSIIVGVGDWSVALFGRFSPPPQRPPPIRMGKIPASGGERGKRPFYP